MNKDTDVLLEIARLRAMNRWLLIAMLSLGALFGVLLWLDLSRVKTEVRAEQFVLLDHSHRPIAKLRGERSGACLELAGESKVAAATICASDDIGSYLSLTNRGGETHAILSAGINLSESVVGHYPAGVFVSDGNGQRILSASVGAESKFALGDSTEQSTFIVVIPSNDKPWLGLKYKGAIVPFKENAKGE